MLILTIVRKTRYAFLLKFTDVNKTQENKKKLKMTG